MPVYNGERYLRGAIESILQQTFADFEFLIINDASADLSVAITESYKDPRIRLVHNEYNLGLIASLNRGLNLATGEYIARMDCDDISLPERFEKQVEYMEKNPDFGVLGTGFYIIDDSGKKVTDNNCYQFPNYHFPLQNDLINWALCFYNPIAHPTVLMRKDILKEVDGYNLSALHCEDYDLWCRLSRVTKLANLGDALVCLRKHKENITSVRYTEAAVNGAEISRKRISEELGRNIPSILPSPGVTVLKFANQDAAHAASVAFDIYRVYIRKRLHAEAMKLIRGDTSKRLFVTALLHFFDYRYWKYLFIALWLSPFVPFLTVMDVAVILSQSLKQKPFFRSRNTSL